MGSIAPKVAILILNWNGMRDTLETLVSGRRNLGLEAILHRPDADCDLILDNDVAVEPLPPSTLLAAAEAKADIGIVGPVLYHQADLRRIRSDLPDPMRHFRLTTSERIN